MGAAPLELKSAMSNLSVKGLDVSEIFSENAAAKIVQVTQRGLRQQAPLPTYPHTVPQSGPNAGSYEHREADFGTCGFFPGCIYTLIERSIKFPQSIQIPSHPPPQLRDQLLKMGRHWSVAINQMSSRTDTHDMGFIVQPALQMDYELTGSTESLQPVINAAYALASRWDNRVKAIRSWDVAINDRYSITDMNENFLVIIDSMCNLDLLYYVGHTVHDPNLISIATQHATTIMSEILRSDFSSYHLVNFNPQTGKAKARMTNQGHADDSTWSRGQAWSIMGFAQTYRWTKDLKFLNTAIRCTDYFVGRLEEAKGKWGSPFVPAWDFDGPMKDGKLLRDVSAGVIAANGMLLIHQALQSLPESALAELQLAPKKDTYLELALRIVGETLHLALDRDFASFTSPTKVANGLYVANGTNGTTSEAELKVNESAFDAILRHATANNNEHAHKPYWDHGLVYADYYLLEFGNKLLRMGLV